MFALAFALRGTLIATQHLERDAFIELVRERFRALGTPYRETETLAAAESLCVPAKDEIVSLRRMAHMVTRLVGDAVPEQVLIARFRQIADRLAPQRVTALPRTRETLERIAALGIPMAVLCNGWSRIARREAECAGFTGPVLGSEDLGVDKLSPRAFGRLVEALGLPAEFIWYVGNDPRRDVDGAVKAGFTAVWLNRDGATYPADLEPPALTVRSLDEILPPGCEEYTRPLLFLRQLLRPGRERHGTEHLPLAEKW